MDICPALLLGQFPFAVPAVNEVDDTDFPQDVEVCMKGGKRKEERRKEERGKTHRRNREVGGEKRGEGWEERRLSGPRFEGVCSI